MNSRMNMNRIKTFLEEKMHFKERFTCIPELIFLFLFYSECSVVCLFLFLILFMCFFVCFVFSFLFYLFLLWKWCAESKKDNQPFNSQMMMKSMLQELFETICNHRTEDGRLLCESFIRVPKSGELYLKMFFKTQTKINHALCLRAQGHFLGSLVLMTKKNIFGLKVVGS